MVGKEEESERREGRREVLTYRAIDNANLQYGGTFQIVIKTTQYTYYERGGNVNNR